MNNKKSTFLILLVVILFVGCGTKEKGYSSMDSKVESGEGNKISGEDLNNGDNFTSEDKSGTEYHASDKYASMENVIISDDKNNQFVTNIKSVVKNQEDLLPDTEYIVQSQNVFLCHFVNNDMFREYQDMLVERGFTLYKEENIEDHIYYQYYGDVIGIEIVQLSEVTMVSFVPNNQGISNESGLPKDEVLSLIQKEEYDEWSSMEKTKDTVRRKPEIVFKHWIYELYEKTQMEVYVTFTSEGKESGTYLIHKERAYEIMDSLDNICIADIDQNGTYELLSLYGFGSGIYRIHLKVYQYSNPRFFSSLTEIVHVNYYNCYIPMQGYSQLKFRKIDDTTVHLMEDKENGKDYGKLMIEEDGIHINPELMAEFPYYQWDIDFDPQNISPNLYTPKDLQQIPELTIKIGDTIIENRSRKIDWHGEEEDKVTFATLMEDEIPMFRIPSEEEDKLEISLSFSEIRPTSVKVVDHLITERGVEIYGNASMEERPVRYGKDGNYYIALTQHWALMLSSSMAAYENPSYRGYRVTCEFGENQTCEYVFVLSTEPMWTVISDPLQSSR